MTSWPGRSVGGAIGSAVPICNFPGCLPPSKTGGIGVCVLRWIETEAVSDGGRHVGIMVSEFNGGARKLYERKRYHAFAAVPDVVRDGFAELLMRKRV